MMKKALMLFIVIGFIELPSFSHALECKDGSEGISGKTEKRLLTWLKESKIDGIDTNCKLGDDKYLMFISAAAHFSQGLYFIDSSEKEPRMVLV